jgi:glyoxylase-like metal-dependent hydrolase (beta-lactamase superfamily II)
MPVWICTACAVEYADTVEPPARCEICSDDRQYVPLSTGQVWTTLDELTAAGTRVTVTEVEPDLFGVRAVPSVGIGQRAHLIRTDGGTVLCDPTGYVDAAGAALVLEHGPVVAIAASHPHMFGVQVEWSRALGGVPVYVSAKDREWVQRPDDAIRFFDDDTEVAPGITLRIVGGHFAGSVIAYWAAGAEGRGVVLSGDTIFPGQDGKWVSFARSFPNHIPLSAAVVNRVAIAATAHPFDRLYGNFGWVVPTDARAIVRRSADRHIAWVSGDYDHLT